MAGYHAAWEMPYSTGLLRLSEGFAMSIAPPQANRYPEVEDCTWSTPGKCRCVDCRYNLLADRPRIRDWAPEDVDELVATLPSTCSLDLASLGPLLFDEIVAYMGLPRPQVEQLELSAARKLGRMRELRRAHWDGH